MKTRTFALPHRLWAASLVLLSLFSVLLVLPEPAQADGLVVIDCPPIVVPPMPRIEPQPTSWPPFPLPPLPPVPPPVPPRQTACTNYLSVKNHNVSVTIDNQVARTHVDETFLNDSNFQLEGTYIFPLPEDATIGDFAMWVDGKKLEGQVLDRNQARRIYEDIVRRQRDPALLEYVGRNAFQARIFPIAPHTDKRVEIEYSQVLKAEQGLVRYVYPLNTEKFSPKPLQSVSINVSIRSNAALKSIYSPTHNVSVAREGDYAAKIGYEDAKVTPDRDFVLYYSVSQDDIGLNLLSYRSGNDDGFFLMLVAPKVEVPPSQVIAKDVILILDVSGSMQGPKIDQAKRALDWILDRLHPDDRFNIISFSTGINSYASSLQPASARAEARNFVSRLRAEGSTDINRALLEGMHLADRERPAIVIFLTDGLPTTGETNSQRIIANVTNAAPKNVRLFTFGVGDDVNTLLLDSLADPLRGASGYVRPNEKIDEIVSAFYAKVSTPVLSDLRVDWGKIQVNDVYPYPLPDLFAGSQLVIAGRYRGGGATDVTLTGTVNGIAQTFKYSDITFRNAGGDDFIPRLWGTRKIGYLLNQIRLNGESKEAVSEIVTVAVRYGIVTPYTSFLIDERQDVLTERGRTGASKDLSTQLAPAAQPTAGAAAVQQSQSQSQLRGANVAPAAPTAAPGSATTTQPAAVQYVGDKTFLLRNGVWTDTQFDPSKAMTQKVEFGSEAYFTLSQNADFGKYLALGSRVIVVVNGTAYEITDNGSGATSSSAAPTPVPALLAPSQPALPTLASTASGTPAPRWMSEITPQAGAAGLSLWLGVGGIIGLAAVVAMSLVLRVRSMPPS